MKTYRALAINWQSSSVRFFGGTMNFLTSSGIVICSCRFLLEVHAVQKIVAINKIEIWSDVNYRNTRKRLLRCNGKISTNDNF